MKPEKQKAEELVNKMLWSEFWMDHFTAKKCALIAVEELIKEQTMWQNGQPNPVLYWQKVKQEIIKL